MARLFVHVEGQTEESFVNNLLRDHLFDAGYHDVSARLLGNARLRSHRGGIRPWKLAKADIVRHLKGDPSCFSTTMVDFYGLPHSWPGRIAAARYNKTSDKANCVETAVFEEISLELGSGFNPNRLIPFVIMHEFEGLLFSDCDSLGQAIGNPSMVTDLKRIRRAYATPEDINDSPESAPSKHLLEIQPRYQKPIMGVAAASAVGIDSIRRECPHFNSWLTRLESLAQI